MFLPESLQPGSVFAGDFRIERPLAAGGMGAVYVAEQLSTGRKRALKLMHPDLVANPRNRERFEQEAKIGSHIASDHIVEVVAAGVDETTGVPWLAMELLEGETLSSAVRRQGRLSPSDLLEVMKQLGHALGAAHAAGIVHRDLKPDNLFLATPRRLGVPFTLKVLDFGIAKFSQDVRVTGAQTGSIGSPLWMAPEQAGSGSVTPATDVWPLGLIAFEVLTGRSYWRSASGEEATLQALLAEIMVQPLEGASARAETLGVAGGLPFGFDEWFAHCVAREPERRFADAAQAVDAMVALSTGTLPAISPVASTDVRASASGAAVSAASTGAVHKSKGGGLWLIAVAVVAVGGVAVVGLGGAAYLWSQSGSASSRASGPSATTSSAQLAAPAGAPLGSSAESSAPSTARGKALPASSKPAVTPAGTAPAAAAPPASAVQVATAEDLTPKRKLNFAGLDSAVRYCWKGNEGESPDAGGFTVTVSFEVDQYGRASKIKVSPATYKGFTGCTVVKVSDHGFGSGDGSLPGQFSVNL